MIYQHARAPARQPVSPRDRLGAHTHRREVLRYNRIRFWQLIIRLFVVTPVAAAENNNFIPRLHYTPADLTITHICLYLLYNIRSLILV